MVSVIVLRGILVMLHNIIMILSGMVGTCAILNFRGRYLHSRNQISPINLIDGIVLPNVDDPAWISHPTIHERFDLGNVVASYKKCHATHHENNRCKESGHFFIQQRQPGDEGFWNLCMDIRAETYYREVKRNHIKYMVECPEIKRLDAIK